MKGPSFYRGFCNTLEKRKGKEKKKEENFSLFFTQASYQTLTLTLTLAFAFFSIFVYFEETKIDLYINICQSLKETTYRNAILFRFLFGNCIVISKRQSFLIFGSILQDYIVYNFIHCCFVIM